MYDLLVVPTRRKTLVLDILKCIQLLKLYFLGEGFIRSLVQLGKIHKELGDRCIHNGGDGGNVQYLCVDIFIMIFALVNISDAGLLMNYLLRKLIY